MFVIHLLRVVHSKCLGYVRSSSFAVLQRLFGCVPHTRHVRRINRYTRYLTQPSGDILGLVVPAFPQTSRMQGHGDDDIDVIEKLLVSGIQHRLSCEPETQLRFVGVFHAMNDALDGMIFLIEEVRPSPLQVHRMLTGHDTVRECRFRAILPQVVLFCAR